MQSLYEKYSENYTYTKQNVAKQHVCVFVSTNQFAGDPGEVEIDSRLWEMESIQAFPEAVKSEPANTSIHTPVSKHYHEKSEFHWDSFQQSLGMLQTDAISYYRHTNLFKKVPL